MVACSSVFKIGVTSKTDACQKEGANWVRPGSLKCKWRAVVGQLATIKADHYFNC
jgi:hypothetical protein